MAIYTVHESANAPDAVTRADRTVFIREGFSVWGLVFGPLYLLRHRLWLAVLGWLVLLGVVAALFTVLHFEESACLLLMALGHLFVGVEGNDLRRWALGRRGYRLVDVVSGIERAAAEQVFFDRRGEFTAAEQQSPRPWSGGPDPTPTVIGMFPDGHLS